MANFCCPIETEPRTLNQGLLNQAREIAVDIVKNKELDEATAIFNEGLKPIEGVNVKAMPVASPHKGGSIMKTCCQCSCNSTVDDEFPDQCRIEESVSVPL